MSKRIILATVMAMFIATCTTNSSTTGLGITRSKLVRAMGGMFAFAKGANTDGQENYTATSEDGTTVVGIIGPEAEITSASIMTYREARNPKLAQRGVSYMKVFAEAIVRGSNKWIVATIDASDQSTNWDATTTLDGITLKLTHNTVGADHAYVLEMRSV